MTKMTFSEYEELCKRAREQTALKQRLLLQKIQTAPKYEPEDKRDDWPQA